ncbi:hypothetical protein HOP50_03g20640 [Chloropicon primus]|uniref:Uncharacterized protein n=1 Tax=Chloropicon primus TaxID=1764295 RepID=A0A5B8MGG1_9CHLO|nr:hypothetical protein A3770_03p20640 [Chloropicon primus]UPQ98758.1 hypothetical protein HOP50_03g20640 [Chloropicon primus]|eukprot:QDZ19546.1 hypothetical protein A3770_03p20640 [Chloropicon primus]
MGLREWSEDEEDEEPVTRRAPHDVLEMEEERERALFPSDYRAGLDWQGAKAQPQKKRYDYRRRVSGVFEEPHSDDEGADDLRDFIAHEEESEESEEGSEEGEGKEESEEGNKEEEKSRRRKSLVLDSEDDEDDEGVVEVQLGARRRSGASAGGNAKRQRWSDKLDDSSEGLEGSDSELGELQVGSDRRGSGRQNPCLSETEDEEQASKDEEQASKDEAGESPAGRGALDPPDPAQKEPKSPSS